MSEIAIPGAVEEALPRPKSRNRVTGVQLMLGMGLAIGLIFALNFSSRISLDRSLAQIHRQFSDEIDQLLAQQEALNAELNYVKSDVYVEFWARDEGKMIREGEVLIFPQSLGAAAAPPQSTVELVAFETTVPQPQNWEIWWALFFDGPPPGIG